MTDSPAADSGRELPRATERLAVSVLVIAAFALNLNANVLGALLPFLRAELPAGQGATAGLIVEAGDAKILIAFSALGMAVGALAVSAVSRAIGRRRTLVAGLLVFVAASLAHLIPGGFWLFASMRAVSGAAAGLAYSAASAAAAHVSPYGRRGATMGWFSAGMFLAIPIGMPLTVLLAGAGYWQAIFAVQALIGVFAAVGAWRVLPADLPGEAHRAPWSEVLANRQVRAGLLATLLHVGSFFTVVQLATVWLDDTGLVPKEEQIYLWVGLGILSVFGSAGLGRLSDRIGKRAFVLGCSVVLVACFGLLARQPGPALMLAVAIVLALAAAARTGPLQALVSGLVPDSHLSTLMGLRSASMQLGAGLFALISAPIAAELGFEGILWLAALCQVCSYGAIRFGVRKA